MKRPYRTGATLATLVALAVAALPGETRAAPDDVKKTCVEAHLAGQAKKSTGKLKAARSDFARCAAAVCPQVVAEDCAKLGAEVQQAMPTIVIAAIGTDGREVAAVKVRVDGEPLLDRLDGRAVEIDPGEHTFHFEHGALSQEEKLIIREGERNRIIKVTFADKTMPPAASVASSSRPVPSAAHSASAAASASAVARRPPPPAPPPVGPSATAPAAAERATIPTVGLVTGIVGVGASLGLGVWALSLKGTVADKCNVDTKVCVDQEGKDAAATGSTVATLSTVAAVVGVTGFGVWLLWPSESSAVGVRASPLVGGGAVSLGSAW